MSRKERVERALRDHLTELIAREVKDPRVTAAGVLGVSRVECTTDLSVARVWISVYADDAVAERALVALRAAAGFLRGPLARRVHLPRPPELRFARDVTAEMSLKLAAIVRDDADRARASGRDPDAAAVAPGDEAAAAPGDDAAAAPGDEAAAAPGDDAADPGASSDDGGPVADVDLGVTRD